MRKNIMILAILLILPLVLCSCSISRPCPEAQQLVFKKYVGHKLVLTSPMFFGRYKDMFSDYYFVAGLVGDKEEYMELFRKGQWHGPDGGDEYKIIDIIDAGTEIVIIDAVDAGHMNVTPKIFIMGKIMNHEKYSGYKVAVDKLMHYFTIDPFGDYPDIENSFIEGEAAFVD
ncbi:MAG: hypothetical protein JEZ07_00595 [Phycisphaerae bacterium]|nr:hypothetical protein [Phycisphaerae bacterium]